MMASPLSLHSRGHSPVEEARERAASLLLIASEQADLAARAEALGDTFGASRFARMAHQNIIEFWRAHVALQDLAEEARHACQR
jgi:hypothetical protein